MTVVRRVVARLGRALVSAVRGYAGHLGPQLSAAIAYHALLSLFPLLILLVAVLGLVLQDDQVKASVTDWLLDALPLSEGAQVDVERAVEGIATPASAAGILSLGVLAWAASGAMAAVRTGLDLVWEPPRRRLPGRAKLFDLLLVLVAGLLVLVSLGLTVVSEVVFDVRDLGAFESVVSAAGELTRLALPFLLTFGTFVLLYARVPAARPPVGTVWLGALIAAGVFEGLKFGFAAYLASFARYNLVYGSLGAVVALLAFAYLAGMVLLLGAELAAAWPGSREPAEKQASEREPLVRQVRRVVRGLFFHDADERSDNSPETHG